MSSLPPSLTQLRLGGSQDCLRRDFVDLAVARNGDLPCRAESPLLVVPLACHLSPCEAVRLRCTGDPLDQDRPFHKAKSTLLDCIKSSALDRLPHESCDRVP